MRGMRGTLVVSFGKIPFASYNKSKKELAAMSIHVHKDTVVLAIHRLRFLSFVAAKKPRLSEQKRKKRRRCVSIWSFRLSPNWKRFWSLKIPLPARNVLYRMLHNKVNNRFHLHRLMPHTVPNNFCIHCPSNLITSIDTLDHFYFLCPTKYAVWSHCFSKYINPNIRAPSVNLLRQ
ncbi:hypothetical protein CU098_006547, partial [Rhizopus stolonifer]